jgi:zinc protease
VLATSWLLVALTSTPALAQLDLRNATSTRLDNGMTVLLLPDRNFPVVSVQMLYRAGARDELPGKTGLAHFLEHLAFRSSEAFPGTGLVSSIYAVGGEWHGYSWTDLTTYFATAPAGQLDLLLRIEAERMTRLELDPAVMEAERGAVFTEMRSYDDDPVSLLVDAAALTSFTVHPYRHNSIGWSSDVAAIEHADVLDFYRRYYHPANAVLAIVGDFDPAVAMSTVSSLFAAIPARPAAVAPTSQEPAQQGERRTMLRQGAWPRQLRVAYRAPSSAHPDAAAFLVLQELLGGGSGVSFLQNDWGTAVRPGSLLAGAAEDLTTWYPPSAQDYLFMIGASAHDGQSDEDVEAAIEAAVTQLRAEPVSAASLADAIGRVQDELLFDVQTTEDAAHQLAYFSGISALDELLSLPQRVAAVTTADVQRVAGRWLGPQQRSIVWLHPALAGPGAATDDRQAVAALAPIPAAGAGAVDLEPLPPPQLHYLHGRLPVLLQASDLSASVHLQLVYHGGELDQPGALGNSPAVGYSSVVFAGRADTLNDLLEQAQAWHRQGPRTVAPATPAPSDAPSEHLEQAMGRYMRPAQATPAGEPAPLALLVVSGDIATEQVLARLNTVFGHLPAPPPPAAGPAPEPQAGSMLSLRLARPLAQAQLGYIAEVPGPRSDAYLATRFLQYLLAHEYQGRFGDQAVSERGLAYYLDHRYRSDGRQGWATLSTGVNPENLPALTELWLDSLAQLRAQPPTPGELEAARGYFLGRLYTAAQSNDELAGQLARHWLWHAELRDRQHIEAQLRSVTHQQLVDAVEAYVNGLTIEVRE